MQYSKSQRSGLLGVFSLDWERDYGSGEIESAKRVATLLEASASREIPMHVFAEGKLLESLPKSDIEYIKNHRQIELGIHCWDHERYIDDKESIKKLTVLYKRLFGYRAKSYRAGNYRIDAEVIRSLAEQGVKIDSSLIAGRGRLDIERVAIENTLKEVQVSTITRLHIPLSAIYIICLYPILKLLYCLNYRPRIACKDGVIVFNCHMTDIYPRPVCCARSKSIRTREKLLITTYAALMKMLLPKEHLVHLLLEAVVLIAENAGITRFTTLSQL